jgi:hypothetical protein
LLQSASLVNDGCALWRASLSPAWRRDVRSSGVPTFCACVCVVKESCWGVVCLNSSVRGQRPGVHTNTRLARYRNRRARVRCVCALLPLMQATTRLLMMQATPGIKMPGLAPKCSCINKGQRGGGVRTRNTAKRDAPAAKATGRVCGRIRAWRHHTRAHSTAKQRVAIERAVTA